MRNRWFVGSTAGVLSLAFSGLALAGGEIMPETGNRMESSKKGSFLAYSKVELRWDQNGDLTQDTIIELTNDHFAQSGVCVQMYLVMGDPPLDPVYDVDPPDAILVPGEPGWEWVDCVRCLTHDDPTYWSVATGLPDGCSPFEVLDPDTGDGPGRPDPDRPGHRMLRGFVYAWAVDETGAQIKWNHLSGGATLINYLEGSAWEYNAWAAQVPGDAPHGSNVGTSGILKFDGVEYDAPPALLNVDFFASNSTALSNGASIVTVDTDLTLHPLTADLRQDSFGPVTTKAHIDVWNANEISFSGLTRCITCWDQTLMSQYTVGGAKNHFLRNNLQTDKGKARIDGMESTVCDVNCIRESGDLDVDQILDILGIDHVCSYDSALLGVSAKVLAFSGASTGVATAGRNLVGSGEQRAFIKWDLIRPPLDMVEAAANGPRNDSKAGRTTRGGTRTGDSAEPVSPIRLPLE
jgi:hypothetical protein